jgi:hypothetical protein
MKSQKRRRLWPTPGCNAMEEEEVWKVAVLTIVEVPFRNFREMKKTTKN